MHEGIRDTSAQDVLLEKNSRLGWLKWTIAAAVGLVIIFALGSVLSTWMSAEASVSADRIRTAIVNRGDLVRDLNVQGRVVAAVSPTLYSPATGTVTLEVMPGDTVTIGQVLATIDSPEVRSEFLQEQSTLDSLAAELKRDTIQARKAQVTSQQTIDLARVKLTAAEREMRRAEKSIETNAISEIDYERSRDELARAKVEFNHAVQDSQLESESLEFETTTRQLAVSRQELVVKELQRRVDDLAIRSPVNGIVGNVEVTQKAVVTQNTPLITVVDLTAFQVEIRIPEAYADDLGIGLAGEVQYNGTGFRGELVSLSPEVVNNEVIGRIRFTDQTPPGLRQNQRVTVRVMMDELLSVLKLQRGAFADGGGGRLAFVLAENGLAERRNIQLGARSAAEVEVISGLAEGEEVIISSIAEFTEYDTIQVVD
ncbi:MAG: efflux RND transporter periplasmic adaptor subunit [Xanthomonadales bacterium]|jgi:HlyD family secretion protein|nr:efflux RND transporter periplasmic adaptor subunit [Xanthomonadales bacterium]MDH3940762.1 efflux RND transporter periplasmic adaptor subunit [Xanthomonadales bacterium]MDH4001850.1 efflux RND transporter periplasmic adaptor subunit [Xanthomonadales bacterium]